MPNLGDVLGHVMAEISMARMQADIESVRIAEFYASHPLLKNLAVPRFRLPTIDVDIPVLVDRVEEVPDAGPPRGTVTTEALRQPFESTVREFLATEGLAVTSEEFAGLRSTFDRTAGSTFGPAAIAPDVVGLAGTMSRHVATNVAALRPRPDGPVDEARSKALEEALRVTLINRLLVHRPPPPRLAVVATTTAVRDANAGENVVRLRLSISEESVEWTTREDDDGAEERRLVPE